jgi:hypothetical protein
MPPSDCGRYATATAYTSCSLRIVAPPGIFHRQIPTGAYWFGGGIGCEPCYAGLCLSREREEEA